jgi:glycosyltransferase involved in cell wall biosynthesis
VRAELDLPAERPTVVTVCRLFKEKGMAELLRAVARARDKVPDVLLVVVGRDVTGGVFLRELEAIVEAEGLQHQVRFVGQRSDVPRFMAAADVFAMPSFEEPFGIVFAEAMAMELPVVALNNGGTPEVVEDGRTGLLSDPGDIDALADHLVDLLRDPARRVEMGAYGRARVKELFTVEQLASAMAAIYEELAS